MIFVGEIGINANGSIEDAIKLITMAKECGFDAIKFQKREVDIVYTSDLLSEKRESPWGDTQREQKEGLEFSEDDYKKIDAYCKNLGIDWFASAWDMSSQRFLRQFDLKYNKVASAMITHTELLEMIAKEQKMTFISTGLSTNKEIANAVEIFEKNKCPYMIMHCVSLYPCPDELCNLDRMIGLKAEYGRKMYCKGIGYSGHELGLTPSLLAVSMGAKAIERHITLDRASYGSDQSASLEKAGMERLVREAKLIPQMIKSDRHKIEELEKPIANKLRYFHSEVLCKKG
jgi:N-acetylneuraminate synthase